MGSTEKSGQWSFEVPIDVNTFANLSVAATEEDILYLTYTKKVNKNVIVGYVKTKKCNKRSAMKKLIEKSGVY
jgi:hypothetical protein